MNLDDVTAAWRSEDLSPLYGVDKTGILKCLDWRNGFNRCLLEGQYRIDSCQKGQSENTCNRNKNPLSICDIFFFSSLLICFYGC